MEVVETLTVIHDAFVLSDGFFVQADEGARGHYT
jgi:hypothetical protein